MRMAWEALSCHGAQLNPALFCQHFSSLWKYFCIIVKIGEPAGAVLGSWLVGYCMPAHLLPRCPDLIFYLWWGVSEESR